MSVRRCGMTSRRIRQNACITRKVIHVIRELEKCFESTAIPPRPPPCVKSEQKFHVIFLVLGDIQPLRMDSVVLLIKRHIHVPWYEMVIH